MAHYNFKKDLKDALVVEREVMQRLERTFLGLYDLSQSQTQAYDIQGVFDTKAIFFEVKNDLRAHETGNVAIEYECRGKKSGLSVSTADFWAYKFMESFYLFDRNKLLDELFSKKNYYRKVVGGDTGSQTKLFLVKAAIFKTWGMLF